MQDGLVTAYDFDEGAGAVLHDKSGNGNHGTIHGATWVKLGDGHALRFDGENDYVDCGESKSHDISGPITLEAWVLPEELPRGEALLLGRDMGSYLLTYSGSTYPARAYWHIAAVTKKCRARAVAGLWHHVVGTFDGARLRVHVDGATAGGVRVWKHTPTQAAKKFHIAGGLAGLAYFKGILDEVRVYRRVFSRDEALLRYREGKTRHENTPPLRKAMTGQGVNVLNNLVAELLNVSNPVRQPRVKYSFTNPREGWVFISTTARLNGDAGIHVSLDNAPKEEAVIVHEKPDDRPQEIMRLMSPGEHTVNVWCEGESSLDGIVVRAIPELLYATFPAEPLIREFGTYSWEYLEKDVLRNVTTLVGLPPDAMLPRLKAWQKQGRRWIAEHSAGWYNYRTKKASQSADDFYKVLTGKPGMQHPFVDGILLDTHDVGHSNRYQSYAEAVQRIHGEDAFRSKKLHFYCDCLYGAPMSEKFARTVLDCGYKLVWTRYMHEQPTEEAARSFIEASLADEATGWEKFSPGALGHMIMALGYLTSPGERMNIEPGADYFVFMDMQCNLLANHPAFGGLHGVMWYKSHYAEEEVVRWAGRLFRHYFIEGKTERLSKDPYILPHVRNPDFNRGTEGWSLSPAEDGSIEPRRLDRYGFQQGRWLETGVGDDFLLMRRSAKGPNRFSQEIRNLQPGRLYSLKLFTADYNDIVKGESIKQKHAVTITLDNVDLLPEKCFQTLYSNFSYYHMGPYDDEEAKTKTWINFHRKVFRARAATARLTISDWASETELGGPVGQELMYNFVEVQPYFDNVK